MKLLRHFCFFLLFFQNSISFAQDHLKISDIQTVMQQIFNQHVSQKVMTRVDIKNSLKAYIDKFDPKRMYLLENEVHGYLNLTDAQADAILNDYQQGRYGAFEELNRLIQRSIVRSRSIRKGIEQDSASLFKTAPQNAADPDIKPRFPKSQEALLQRIEDDIIDFINLEKGHFGNSDVMRNQAKIIEFFEKKLREEESEYLYQDENGSPLSKEKQENLFAMHLLKAFTSTLDAHTTFYNESEASDLKMRLEKEFEGIGIGLKRQSDGSIRIDSMLKGGPAAKSGQIKVGDTLLQINGHKITGESFEEVMGLLQNKTETNLVLTLEHQANHEIISVPLKKEEITLQGDRVDLAYKKISGGIIGIITLHSFYQGANGVTSEEDVRKAIDKLNQMGHLQGLILDLRENSGGFLGQAVKVAGLFITNGVIVISKYFNGDEHYYRDLDGKSYYKGPFVILTSRATASAAEIVAQALQDYGVALIVGDETTYGKGTIQNQTVTGEDKGALLFKVTVGKYYTVSGKTPQIDGVKADIVVPGILNFQHVGEKYLDYTVKNDTIQNEYVDDLADVQPNLRTWFLRNYMPTLQRRENTWQNILPTVRANSASRLASNKDYQSFLQQAYQGHITNFFRKDKSGTPQPIDFQLDEALSIVQDMIKMGTKGKTNLIVNKSEKEVAQKSTFSYD